MASSVVNYVHGSVVASQGCLFKFMPDNSILDVSMMPGKNNKLGISNPKARF